MCIMYRVFQGVRYLYRSSPNFAHSVASMYMFDLNQPNSDPRKVALEGYDKDFKECDFHGLAIWTDKQSGMYNVFPLFFSFWIMIFNVIDRQEHNLYRKSSGTWECGRNLWVWRQKKCSHLRGNCWKRGPWPPFVSDTIQWYKI